ncbi:unnamed protein product [Pieris brassicae]|uniref:Uncharacterized protein n=1 Tax=Pieris brassicae TaxID=7116 RepID=A0A9P0TG91_PIEBR|nr:unnamed protein product [Pieris brassicae]
MAEVSDSNQFFVGVGKNLAENIIQKNCSNSVVECSSEGNTSHNSLVMLATDECEVERFAKILRSYKAIIGPPTWGEVVTQSGLDSVTDWHSDNVLTLNAVKTKYMAFTKQGCHPQHQWTNVTSATLKWFVIAFGCKTPLQLEWCTSRFANHCSFTV